VDSMSGSLRLLAALGHEIIAHARAGYPNEICGLIAGRQGVGLVLYRGQNVAPEPRVSFELDANTLLRQMEFEEQGLELVAIYHSHPAGPEKPSETDVARACYPQAAAIICSLAGPHPGLRAFSIVDDKVTELELAWISETGGRSQATEPKLLQQKSHKELTNRARLVKLVFTKRQDVVTSRHVTKGISALTCSCPRRA
jgi:proteasome lid subunit RPN8/RPN11